MVGNSSLLACGRVARNPPRNAHAELSTALASGFFGEADRAGLMEAQLSSVV